MSWVPVLRIGNSSDWQLTFPFVHFLGGYSSVEDSSTMCTELFALLGVPVSNTSSRIKVGHFSKINFNYIVIDIKN